MALHIYEAKVRKILEAVREPGEYVYHASFVGGNLSGLLRSLSNNGLRPSKEGYSGPGAYFAYEPEGCYYHVTKEESIMLRAKWSDLIGLYGTYPESPRGIQRDDDEIIVPGKVPASMLEVEYFHGEWWDIESALSSETRYE